MDERQEYKALCLDVMRELDRIAERVQKLRETCRLAYACAELQEDSAPPKEPSKQR